MADNKKNARIGKTYPVVAELTVAPMRIASQDIDNWRNAINAAKNTLNPRRRLLYEMYENIATDGKVVTVDQKRKVQLTNKQFVFYKNGDEGTPVDRIQKEIIDTEWFDEMLEHLEDEDFYGHTLMEIVPGVQGIERIEKIPHANVVPEKGILLLNYMDTDGLPFRGPNSDPHFQKYFMEYGRPKNLGKLLSMAQYVIYKRGGFGDWAQFAELFGMPFRIGKYDPFDLATRKKLYEALNEMGGAGFAVIPDGTSVEFPTVNYGSGQSGIFKDLIVACDDMLAQIGLGGTMTTINGASKAQGEVHKEGENEIFASRLKKTLKFLNNKFAPLLAQHHGYKELVNGKFGVHAPEVISLTDRIDIDEKLDKIIEIHPTYFYNTYGVPMPDGGAKKKEQQKPDAEGNPDPKGQKKKGKQIGPQNFADRIAAYYKDHTCAHCQSPEPLSAKKLKATSDKEIERIAKALFDKKIKAGSVDKKLLKATAKQLLEGLYDGLGKDPDAFVKTYPETAQIMRENIFIFSGFKTEKQLREASALLVDDQGNMRSFAEFLEKVKAVDATYNVAHLQAEYNHAVASGQMHTKWQTFEDLKEDFPNLIYTTAGDDRVRPSHAALDGTVRPMDDSFWNSNYPPNGWNCRCDVDATDQAVNNTGGSGGGHGKMFMHNVGKDGIVFPESHPYFEASEATRKRVIAASKDAMK